MNSTSLSYLDYEAAVRCVKPLPQVLGLSERLGCGDASRGETSAPGAYDYSGFSLAPVKTGQSCFLTLDPGDVWFAAAIEAARQASSASFGPNNSNPLAREELDVLIARDAQALQQKVIKDITNRLNELGCPRCAEQVEFLHNYDELEEGEKPLALESAQSFLSFIQDADFWCAVSKAGEPLIGVFPGGTLSVEWRTSENDKHLLMTFRANAAVAFAMIEDGALHLRGSGPHKKIIDVLRRQGVTDWKHS